MDDLDACAYLQGGVSDPEPRNALQIIDESARQLQSVQAAMLPGQAAAPLPSAAAAGRLLQKQEARATTGQTQPSRQERPYPHGYNTPSLGAAPLAQQTAYQDMHSMPSSALGGHAVGHRTVPHTFQGLMPTQALHSPFGMPPPASVPPAAFGSQAGPEAEAARAVVGVGAQPTRLPQQPAQGTTTDLPTASNGRFPGAGSLPARTEQNLANPDLHGVYSQPLAQALSQSPDMAHRPWFEPPSPHVQPTPPFQRPYGPAGMQGQLPAPTGGNEGMTFTPSVLALQQLHALLPHLQQSAAVGMHPGAGAFGAVTASAASSGGSIRGAAASFATTSAGALHDYAFARRVDAGGDDGAMATAAAGIYGHAGGGNGDAHNAGTGSAVIVGGGSSSNRVTAAGAGGAGLGDATTSGQDHDHAAWCSRMEAWLGSSCAATREKTHREIAERLRQTADEPGLAARWGLPTEWQDSCGFFMSRGKPKGSRLNTCGGSRTPRPLEVGEGVYLVFLYSDRCTVCPVTLNKNCRANKHPSVRVCMMQLAYRDKPSAPAQRKRFKRPLNAQLGRADSGPGAVAGPSGGSSTASGSLSAGAAVEGAASDGDTADRDGGECDQEARGANDEQGGADGFFSPWVLRDPPAIAWHVYGARQGHQGPTQRTEGQAAGLAGPAPALPLALPSPPPACQPLVPNLRPHPTAWGMAAAVAASAGAALQPVQPSRPDLRPETGFPPAAFAPPAVASARSLALHGGGTDGAATAGAGANGGRGKRLRVEPHVSPAGRPQVLTALPPPDATAGAVLAPPPVWPRNHLWFDQQAAHQQTVAVPPSVQAGWMTHFNLILDHLRSCRSVVTFRRLLEDVEISDLLAMRGPSDGQTLAHLLVTSPRRLLCDDEPTQPPPLNPDEGLGEAEAVEMVQALLERLASKLGREGAEREWRRLLERPDMRHGDTAIHLAGRHGHRMRVLRECVLPYVSRQALLRFTPHLYLCYHTSNRFTRSGAGRLLLGEVANVALELAAFEALRPQLAAALYDDPIAAVRAEDVVSQLVYPLENSFFTGENSPDRGYVSPSGQAGCDLLRDSTAALAREVPAMTAAAAAAASVAADAAARRASGAGDILGTENTTVSGCAATAATAASASAAATVMPQGGQGRPLQPAPPSRTGKTARAGMLGELRQIALALDMFQPQRNRITAIPSPDA